MGQTQFKHSKSKLRLVSVVNQTGPTVNRVKLSEKLLMTIEDSAFAEVLALVDACAAAFVPHELQNVERDSLQVAVASPAQLSRLSEASKMLRRVQKGPKTVKNAKSSRSTRQKPVKQPKGRRPAGYNPNQAREKQRNEILSLRAQVEELEKVQSTLRSAVVEVSGSSNGNKSGGGAKKREEQVWKELAVRQIEQQALAENEGKRLQEKIEIQEKIVAKLQQFFSKASSKVQQDIFTESNVRWILKITWFTGDRRCQSA